MTTIYLTTTPGLACKLLNEKYLWVSIDNDLIGANDKPSPNAKWCCGGSGKQYFVIPIHDLI